MEPVQTTVSGILLAGLLALWKAWASERAEVKRLNEKFTQFLLDTNERERN